VAEKMALTFKTLSGFADFAAAATTEGAATAAVTPTGDGAVAEEHDWQLEPARPTLHLRHDIHVHLPVSEDIAVYNAIFLALRQNFGE
jgi:hypothetical protein